jgi:polar amino acid transport system substrate-binding protein
VGPPFGRGYYAGGIRKDSPVFREKINGALSAMIQDGELQAIYKKWNLWTDEQGRLADVASPSASAPALPDQGSVQGYLGLIVRGAGMTLLISILSMVLAIGVGFLICLGRVYGRRWVRALCLGYVEITRGTPLLIQLYVLYYGLPNIGIQLNAFVAAVLGMGFNYAAYESEIYRTGLLSVPKGQDEAARSLGLTTWQSLWHVLLPQSIKTILPPSTNDFIALFKDTSLVSIITVTELTRAYSQAATATFRFLELGLLTAALYLMMSLPLSFLSRRLEAQTYVVH